MSISKIKTASREEWKALRHGYLGGSDAASVIGLNPFRSAYSLWAEKTNRLPSFDGNLATEVGTYLEDFVAKKFEEITGKKVRRDNLSFRNTDYPFAIANIDRSVVGEDAGLEIKTTSELNLRRFKNGEYPENYYVQCVHYMAVTGKSKWYLAVLVGNRDIKIFEIHRDDAEISALMEAESAFWQNVVNDTPPLTDGDPSTTRTISTIYADSDGTQVDIYPVSDELKRFFSLSNTIKDLEKQRDAAANCIKAYLEDAERGECEHGAVSWKPQSRRTFDVNRFSADHPGVDLSDYYNTSTFRVFKATEAKGA